MASSIDDKNSAARRVRTLRMERGLTQQQLADQAGVSYSFVNQVERGKLTVRLDALNKILGVFGYTMSPIAMIEPRPAVGSEERRSGAVVNEPEEPAPRARPKNDWAVY